MGSVEVFTKPRMLQIEATSVVGGFVDLNGHLILKQRDNTEIDAGNVKGPTGELPSMGIAYRSAATAPSSYPLGFSYFDVTDLADWPGNLLTVVTVRHSANRTVQTVSQKISNRQWVRTETDGNAWTSWTEIAGVKSATTDAQGFVELATSAETIAGSDLARATTPKAIADLLNSLAPVRVPFTNVTRVTIPCEGADEYEIHYELAISAGSVVMQQGSNGVPLTASLYDSNNVYAGGTVSTPTSGGDLNEPANSWHTSPASSGSRTFFNADLKFRHLNENARTRIIGGLGSSIASGTSTSANSTAVGYVNGNYRSSSIQNELYILGATANATLTGYYTIRKIKYQV